MSDDLIKRKDVIATLGVMYERCDTYDITDYRDLMLEAVKVLPSADRPQGEWMWHEDEDICNCSECKFEIDATGCIEPVEYVGVFRYCPNCGCRMRKE